MQPGAGTARKPRNWKDVQLIISSISLALTLGLWGLWSSREKQVSGVQDEALIPSRPQEAVPEPMLLPGQTLFLMTPAPRIDLDRVQSGTAETPQQGQGRRWRQCRRRDRLVLGPCSGTNSGPWAAGSWRSWTPNSPNPSWIRSPLGSRTGSRHSAAFVSIAS